jgi:hypothetical protein
LGYLVHFTDDVLAYLDKLPLSTQAKKRLDDFIDYGIANVDHAFRMDLANRPRSDHPCFVRDFLIADEGADGEITVHQITFVVNDARATVGVLQVVFVDHQ